MAQTTRRKFLDARGGSMFEQFDDDQAVTLSTTYATKLTIDSTEIRQSVITIDGDASINILYKIYGTAKLNPDLTDITTTGWVNLLSSGAYDHNAEKTLTAGTNTRAYESFSNPWEYVIVQIKSASGTPTTKVYHRGQN